MVSQTLQCPNCGAALNYTGGDEMIMRCPYCSSGVIVPFELRDAARQSEPPDSAPGYVLPSFINPAQIAKIQEISRLAHQGEKIEAIKLYREVFDVGLKEAKDAIELLEKGEPVTVVHTQTAPLDVEQFSLELQQLLEEGDKIEAIKRYRQTYQAGLKDSKEAVESFEKTGHLPLSSDSGGELLTTGLAQTIRQANTMIEIVQLVQTGQEDAAIQLYQRAFGASFQEAQQAIHQVSLGVTADTPVITIQTSSLEFPTKKVAATTAGVLGGMSCLGISLAVFITLITVIPVLIAMASSGGPLEGVWNQINPLAYARVSSSFGEEGSGAGLLDDPRGIAIDPVGNLFIANYSDGRVQKFTSTGEYQLLWNIGEGSYPQSMAADRAGNVYIVFQGKIWKYDGATGRSLGQVGGTGDLWFYTIAATADGGLVVAQNTEDILRFDADGNLVFSLADVPGSQTGDPDDVQDMTVDGVGNLYLLTNSDQPILKYSPQGRILARFGSEGDEQGQLRAPSAIAVDGQGRIYVSDFSGIQVFAPDGRYLDSINVEGYAFDMAFNQQGELWAVSNQPKIIKYQLTAP
jgi:ribosomal protein L7/L12/DNA-binding beta-propeller fold protein YncE